MKKNALLFLASFLLLAPSLHAQTTTTPPLYVQLSEAIKNILTAVTIVVGGIWAYIKFVKYEKRWLAANVDALVDVSIQVTVFPGTVPQECILALKAVATNKGKVHTHIDLDNSWFVVETISNMVAVGKSGIAEGADGKKYYVPDSLWDTATAQIRVKMHNPGHALVRAGGSYTSSNICMSVRGIFRVRADFAIAQKDSNVYKKETGYKGSDKLVWTSSVILDAREPDSQIIAVNKDSNVSIEGH